VPAAPKPQGPPHRHTHAASSTVYLSKSQPLSAGPRILTRLPSIARGRQYFRGARAAGSATAPEQPFPQATTSAGRLQDLL
jgi:hypothetical protein